MYYICAGMCNVNNILAICKDNNHQYELQTICITFCIFCINKQFRYKTWKGKGKVSLNWSRVFLAFCFNTQCWTFIKMHRVTLFHDKACIMRHKNISIDLVKRQVCTSMAKSVNKCSNILWYSQRGKEPCKSNIDHLPDTSDQIAEAVSYATSMQFYVKAFYRELIVSCNLAHDISYFQLFWIAPATVRDPVPCYLLYFKEE